VSTSVIEHSLLRVVLDTNVYVSGTILARGTPFQVLEAWRQHVYILVTSEAIIAEIERVLRYPRIRDRYGVREADIGRLVVSLRADALVVPGECVIPPTCSDPDDDKFLACALEAQADCIVTGDPDLLTLGDYRGIVLLKPHEFLARLADGSDFAQRG
jgi:putative PIN family toxin of toxin-antitoxin system